MQLRDTNEHYGSVTRWLHWVTAALIAIMLALGWGGELVSEAGEQWLMPVHIGLGIAVLALGVVRVLWRVANTRRSPRDTGLFGRVATLVQWTLIALLVLIPLSGWLVVSASGHAPSFFGLFALPPLVGESEGFHELGEEVHEILPWVLVTVLALHVLGALKHHFVDADTTLRRMLGSTLRPREAGPR
ncbi:cytochrome b [Arhodomonas sp. AD133]|uniref:cytochrome b n=1 Tax=Arhodomonas sp. AD133 TaxID=3415009 RepID=UPI003EB86C68